MEINKSDWKKELVVKMASNFNCNVSVSEMKLHPTKSEAMHLCDLKDIAVLLCHGRRFSTLLDQYRTSFGISYIQEMTYGYL
jgi:hypothetical protein